MVKSSEELQLLHLEAKQDRNEGDEGALGVAGKMLVVRRLQV